MQYYVVLDTNVLVSAMLKFSSVPGQIANEALGGNIVPLLCDEIINEYREVLSRPKFKFDQKLVDVLIEGIAQRGIMIDAGPVDEIMPDPKDIVFYEVVMESKKKHDPSYNKIFFTAERSDDSVLHYPDESVGVETVSFRIN